jgi:hypothetical protein
MSRGKCMERELNVVNFQVRLSKEEHKKLEQIAGKRNMQKYVRTLIQDAIAGKRGYPYPLHRSEHEALEVILSGPREIAEGIRRTLLGVAAALVGYEVEGVKQTKAR